MASASDVLFNVIVPVLIAISAPAIFLLALFIGFCVILNFPKLRPSSRTSMVIRSLDERTGRRQPAQYLPPDAPRGPADQLHTPELLEAAGRKSS
jgi:hypothetical protein